METVSIWINEENDTEKNQMEIPLQMESPSVKIHRPTHTRLADVHKQRWNNMIPQETYPVYPPNIYYHGNQPQPVNFIPMQGYRLPSAFNAPPKPAFSEADFTLEPNSHPSLFDNNFQENLSPEDYLVEPGSESDCGSAPGSATGSFETLPEVSSVKPSVMMQKFRPEEVTDFKHLIYNLLVDWYNNPEGENLVEPCTIIDKGTLRHGFKFNEKRNPDKKLPEMYVSHLKNAQLHLENQNSPLIQDLYKFYLRSCVELLSKYFEKIDKYTYLYEDEENPLFVPGGSLEDSEMRIKNMKTRSRKRKTNKRGTKSSSRRRGSDF